jgi:hypothetical protein
MTSMFIPLDKNGAGFEDGKGWLPIDFKERI